MILPGAHALRLGVIRGLASEALQVQPCGVDLTLKRVLRVKSAGVVDFDNTQRVSADAEELNFPVSAKSSGQGEEHAGSAPGLLYLSKGAYRVEFNETVKMPLDIMGQLFTRSSVWRSLAWVEAGGMDSGYEGAIGATLVIANEEGIWVSEKARLAQMVFHKLTESTSGYAGQYQGRSWV